MSLDLSPAEISAFSDFVNKEGRYLRDTDAAVSFILSSQQSIRYRIASHGIL